MRQHMLTHQTWSQQGRRLRPSTYAPKMNRTPTPASLDIDSGMSPGEEAPLIRQIVTEFCPRFVYVAALTGFGTDLVARLTLAG